MFRLASPVGQFWPFQWRTLLERLLTQPSVKDEGVARYIDDVMTKPQLMFGGGAVIVGM